MGLTQQLQRLKTSAQAMVGPNTRATWSLRGFGLTKVPLLLYCLPSIEALDEDTCAVKIPLTWRTRNHYRSMYFGALAVGADCAAGYLATHIIEAAGGGVQLLFRDFQATFKRRPEGDTVFTCTDGPAIQQMVADARRTGERINRQVQVVATVPSRSAEPVAEFSLGLSLKRGHL